MLTQAQVLAEIRSGNRKTKCFIDGRDFGRLAGFFPVADWGVFGFEPKVDAPDFTPTPWTRLAVVEQIVRDAEFGLEKAEDERGISSAMMVGVLSTWSWIMEDPDLDGEYVDGYGARFFREALEKYRGILADLRSAEGSE